MSDIGNMSDADGLAHYDAMIATISGDLASYPPLTAADLTASGAIRDEMNDKLLGHNQTQAAGLAATSAKDAARTAMDDDKRRMRSLLKANGVAADKYAALAFPPSGAGGEPSAATVPIATVDTSERLRHTIHFKDAAPGATKRRPAGVIGMEIWAKIDGPPPGNETECTFLALDTKSPYLAEFDPADAGKTAHYLVRWQLKDGSKSAWGETISATITG